MQFAKTVLASAGRRLVDEMRAAQAAVWAEEVERLLPKLGRTEEGLKREGKSVPWKLALAAARSALDQPLTQKRRTLAAEKFGIGQELQCRFRSRQRSGHWPDDRAERQMFADKPARGVV